MNRWRYTLAWGGREETLASAAKRLSVLLESLAELNVGLDAWFVEGSYLGKPVLWDARGSSPVIERHLSSTVREIDLEQGIPPLRINALSIFDGGSPRQARCRLVNAPHSLPVPAWVTPCRVNLDFGAGDDDALLFQDTVVEMLRRMAAAFRPWWILFDDDARNDFGTDDDFYGRPLVGRVTYMNRHYGVPSGSLIADVFDAPDGSIVSIHAKRFTRSEEQDTAVRELRNELAAAGLLLDRSVYEARLALSAPHP